MNEYLKGGLIFTGGIAVGGVATVCVALRSQTLRKAIASAVAEKIVSVVLGEKPSAEKQGPRHRYTNYYHIYQHKYQPEEETK